MTREDVIADAEAADAECQCAVDLVLDAAEKVLAVATSIAVERPETSAELTRQVSVIFQACAFRDMVGQRLARIARGETNADSLARGPVNGGAALDQASVDALLA